MGTGTADEAQYQSAEQRIAQLTLILGTVAACLVAILYAWRWGVGLLIGTMLAWVNFRWLQGGLQALKVLSFAQAGKEKPRVPRWAMIRLLGRYVLIGAAVYAIFAALKVPILSMLVGLCALGAAVMAESIYEVVRSPE